MIKRMRLPPCVHGPACPRCHRPLFVWSDDAWICGDCDTVTTTAPLAPAKEPAGLPFLGIVRADNRVFIIREGA